MEPHLRAQADARPCVVCTFYHSRIPPSGNGPPVIVASYNVRGCRPRRPGGRRADRRRPPRAGRRRHRPPGGLYAPALAPGLAHGAASGPRAPPAPAGHGLRQRDPLPAAAERRPLHRPPDRSSRAARGDRRRYRGRWPASPRHRHPPPPPRERAPAPDEALRDAIRATSPRVPLVILADLNEWFAGARTLRSWLDFGGRSVRSFPSSWPALALDRVLVQPAHLVGEVRAHVSPIACVASDHLPVRAELPPSSRVARGRAARAPRSKTSIRAPPWRFSIVRLVSATAAATTRPRCRAPPAAMPTGT